MENTIRSDYFWQRCPVCNKPPNELHWLPTRHPQEKRKGKADEPLQLFLCTDGHQFSPCRRHKCIISPWKPNKRKGRPEWELQCPRCLVCVYAPAVREIDSTRYEFRKNRKHNWCEVVRTKDMKSFKATIKLSSNGTEHKELKDGTRKTGRPTKGDQVTIKAGSANAGHQGEIMLVDVNKHNAKPFKVKFEDGNTCWYREDEVHHRGEVQYRTKWDKASDSIAEGQDIAFYFIPHETADFPKRKRKGKVVGVTEADISVEYRIRDLFNAKTGTYTKIRTNYKLLTRHYLCKLSVCQLARRGPNCGCKVKDVIPPDILLLHKKLNQPLHPQLESPAPASSCSSPASGGLLGSSCRQHPVASMSTDLPIKKPCVASNDDSSEFRSRDSKSELEKVFGGDSSEWNLHINPDNPGMTSTDQTTTQDDGGCHSTRRKVQNDNSGSALSLEGLSLSNEYTSVPSLVPSLTLSFDDNLGSADSNTKPSDPDVSS